MDAARATFRGVKGETGGGVGVVGDFGAFGGVECDVGLTGGDDRDASGGEQGAEADAEGEGVGWFRSGRAGGVGQDAAGVVAAVGCVEEDDAAGGWLGLGCNGKVRGKKGRKQQREPDGFERPEEGFGAEPSCEPFGQRQTSGAFEAVMNFRAGKVITGSKSLVDSIAFALGETGDGKRRRIARKLGV